MCSSDLYAEGQRRYVESLSAYARQFLELMSKPEVDLIEGLSPAISIEQKTTSRNPRSTVGTVTEIYDYLRLLYARTGIPRCPDHGIDLSAQTVRTDDGSVSFAFDVDPFRKQCLLNGWDDIGLTMQSEGKIDAFEKQQHVQAPWL